MDRSPRRPTSPGPGLRVDGSERLPFDGIAFSDCGTEAIAVTGTFHPLSAVTSDGSGGFHIVFHYDVEAKGTSQATGVRYVTHAGADFTLNSPATTLGFEQTRTDMFTLIGQGPAPNEVLTVLVHITVDANGTVESSVDQFRLRC
jgi:hypothetical protein